MTKENQVMANGYGTYTAGRKVERKKLGKAIVIDKAADESV